MIEANEGTTVKPCSFARAYHSAYAEKKSFEDSLGSAGGTCGSRYREGPCGAIAQAAALSGIPFAVFRAISGLTDGTAAGSYGVFERQAANNSAATAKQALRLLTGKK